MAIDSNNPVAVDAPAADAAALGAAIGALVTPSQSIANWKPSNTARMRKAVGNAIAHTARSRIAFLGSSSVVGIGTGTGTGSLAGARYNAFHAYAARMLQQRGIPTAWNSMWGCQGYPTGTNLSTIDPRISFGDGWTNSLGQSLGDSMFTNTATTDGALSFSPADAFDALDIWFSRFGTGGDFEVFIDGVSIGTQTTLGSPSGAAKVTLSGIAKAIHVVTIKRLSGSVSIIGMETYDSTAPGLDFQGMGWTGSQVSDWINASSPRGPINALKAYAPDVAFLMLGNNDVANGVTVADYKSGMATLIEAAMLSADTIIIGPQDINTESSAPTGSWAPQADQDAFRQARIELAYQYDIPLVDLRGRIGTYDQGNALGLYRDSLHVARLTHAEFGNVIAGMFERV